METLNKIGHITLLVKDQDEALKFYTETLGFQKRQDLPLGNMRWVTVSPKGQTDLELTFVVADSEEKRKSMGKQAGDHVFLTLETDDCRKEYKALKAKGVKFYGKPEVQAWGIDVVFEDLYGNLLDLVQRFKH
ncbi:MAG: VOC family protein [Chloroflexi bacterium]|nr:VOC family protein [Chloroflexota bacterium]MCL5949159.1 VOC family protein [Candidatus Bathyarchaeota archaeon]